MNLGSFTQRLWISLSLYFYTYLVLTFSFDWTSCIYYFYLVPVRICRFIFCWRLHFEMPWFFLVCGIVINPGLIKVLIKVLYTVIIIRDCLSLWFFIWCSSCNNTLICLLIEKFYECVIRHIFSCLNKSFSLKLNITFLCKIIFVECLLHLHWCTINVRVQVAHVRKPHSEFKLRLFKCFLSCISTGYHEAFSLVYFKLSIENLWIQIILLFC